jgi:hypothetical protein
MGSLDEIGKCRRILADAVPLLARGCRIAETALYGYHSVDTVMVSWLGICFFSKASGC